MSPSQSRRRSFEILARIGYGARGGVYVVVGVLALWAAIGAGNRPPGTKGAIRVLLDQPFGFALVAFVTIGLVGFALWRFAQAALDADGLGTSWKAIGSRVGYAGSGIAYLALAVYAGSLPQGSGSGGEDQAIQDWTTRAMALPVGRWLVAAGGAVAIIGGVAMAWSGLSKSFPRWRRMEAAPGWALLLGRVGYLTFGVLVAIIGGFALASALAVDPSQAIGLPGALDAVQHTRYGAPSLAAAAFGLVAFGAFNIAQALWRRVPAPDPAEAARAAENAVHTVRQNVASGSDTGQARPIHPLRGRR
ncbi:MAG: hypothetical protein JWL84_5684 [Rhodospirillales bacterium]|nr:hypothetical protein [Rhodospirillales bacterium]